MTKFLNISTDNTLGGNSPSDVTVSSQKAIKEYVDNNSGGAVDNSTINKNSSNQLQAIGLINKNTASGATNPKYDWVGTLQEYNDQAVATNHPEWICYITDDVSGGESVYTKNEVNTLLAGKYDASNPNGYQANVIETVKVNGTALTPSSKAVNITVPTVDQTYSATSSNAQSGVAVASAISGKANDSDVVKLTGNQSIAGTKTFTTDVKITAGTPIIRPRSTTMDITQTGWASGRNSIWCEDKNGNESGGFYNTISSGDTAVRTSIYAISKKTGTQKNYSITVGVDGSGNAFTSAPTPATSDNSTKIATTAYVVNVLKAIYPVGAIYIGTTSTCPLAAFFGTWTLKSAGRVLQGASSGHSAGSTIEAGLPNLPIVTIKNHTGFPNGSTDTGNGTDYQGYWRGWEEGTSIVKSDTIYGNSTTVQPPAYVVNIWERTA